MTVENITDDEWIELAGMHDFITQYGSGSSLQDISLQDLYRYLKNPYSNIKEIQRASKYLTNKHGIIKEALRAAKALPSLEHTISWSDVDDEKKLRNYERKANNFLNEINVKNFVRDGLYEVCEMGTIVTCLRNKKYVQFLEIDDLRINKQRNGRWVVEYDLSTIKKIKNTQGKLSVIESLPEEVTIEKYNLYVNKGEDYRYVELKNADVINIDGNRNMPYGLPLTMGSWSALLQKEIIDQVERSVADRLLKNIVILTGGHLDKAGEKPVPKELITMYFNEVSKLFKKKNGTAYNTNVDTSGTGVVAFPHFIKLDTLKVDTELFKKELYSKIENDIYSNLGISPAVLWGGGESGNFSSATLNGEKFFRYIFSILEKFEVVINRYINEILPNKVSCKFVFSKSSMLDKDKRIGHLKDLYIQMGISKFYLEEVTGLPYEDIIAQAEYEKTVLKTEDYLYPPQNAFTQSGASGDDKGGRPTEESPTNDNTGKSQASGGNNSPKPSTM